MTQQELAVRCGVAQPNIGAYETGRRTPSAQMVHRIVSAAKPRPSTLLRDHRAEVLALAAENHADNVRVFGSIARGEDTPDSDIDLLVRFDQDASLFDLVRFAEKLEIMLGVHVDVVSENGLSDDGTDDRQQEIRQQAIAI
jgi:predicted nucleotidyltransferase